MSTNIVDQINKNVMPDDVLFHLGDWSFGGLQNVWNFRKRLNCKNIYLCLGNHDHHIKKNKTLPNQYKELAEDYWWYAKQLFTDVQLMYEIQVHGQRMTLSHYSMRTWFYHNKGSWMLFGHSHGSLQPEGKTIDVGIDNAYKVLGEYRPFKLQELQKIMSKKEYVKVDGHGTKD
jgi:calcineurin-like phosphoesterase family protein